MRRIMTAAIAVLAVATASFVDAPRAEAQLPGYENGVIGEIVKVWPVGLGIWSDECRILNRHDGGYDVSCNKGDYFVPYRWVVRMNGPSAAAPVAQAPAPAAGGTASGLPGYETAVIGEIVKAWPVGLGIWSDECRVLNRHDGGYDLSCNKGEYFVPYRQVARMNGPTAAAKPAPQPAPQPVDDDEPEPAIPQLTKGTYRCYDDDDRYTRQNVVLTSKTAYKDRRGRSGRYRQNDDLLTFTSGPYKGWDASVDTEGAITITDPKTDVTTTCRKG